MLEFLKNYSEFPKTFFFTDLAMSRYIFTPTALEEKQRPKPCCCACSFIWNDILVSSFHQLPLSSSFAPISLGSSPSSLYPHLPASPCFCLCLLYLNSASKSWNQLIAQQNGQISYLKELYLSLFWKGNYQYSASPVNVGRDLREFCYHTYGDPHSYPLNVWGLNKLPVVQILSTVFPQSQAKMKICSLKIQMQLFNAKDFSV